MKLLIIAIIATALIAVLGIGGYFYLQGTQTAPVTQTPVTKTETPKNDVDKLDEELNEMKTDDTSEDISPTDYSGL